MNDLKEEIKLLKQKIDELNSWRNNIYNELDSTLRGKGFIKADSPNLPPSSTYTSDSGFRRDIILSGAGETITVPAFPTSFRKEANSNFYIPLHTFSQITA